MKTHTKALLASMVVIALAVSSVGVTYSWFSDTAEIDTNVSAATVDVDFRIIGDDGSGISLAAGEREYILRIVNHSTIAVSVEPSFEVVRYYAAANVNGYVCDVKQGESGWVKDAESSAKANNGNAAWSGNDSSGYMMQASFGGSAYDHFSSVNGQVAGASYEDDGSSYNVYEAVYSISSGLEMQPGEVRDIQFKLKVDSRCSIDPDHMPKLLVRASQSHEAGSIFVFSVDDSTTIDKSAIAGYDSLEFSRSNGSSIILDNAAMTSDWDSIAVSFAESAAVMTISVQAQKGGVQVDLEGWIHYRIAVGDGVKGVTDGTDPIPVTIRCSDSGAIVDFIDVASKEVHSVSYA